MTECDVTRVYSFTRHESDQMVNVFLIFGTLVALNIGFGYVFSERMYEEEAPEGEIIIEEVEEGTKDR